MTKAVVPITDILETCSVQMSSWQGGSTTTILLAEQLHQGHIRRRSKHFGLLMTSTITVRYNFSFSSDCQWRSKCHRQRRRMASVSIIAEINGRWTRLVIRKNESATKCCSGPIILLLCKPISYFQSGYVLGRSKIFELMTNEHRHTWTWEIVLYFKNSSSCASSDRWDSRVKLAG